MGEVRVIPLTGIPEVTPGDDLAALLVRAIESERLRLEDDDIVAVTQKVVSKAEGRVVAEGPDGKVAWVARETQRVVATREELVIAETRHGFVCANAGVDASNVAPGFLTLLPEDPDGSAERIRNAIADATGARIGVVVTDTFGRAWRQGVVNVAIGCAGLPSIVDLRGSKDAVGRVLEATIVAMADEVAAASGLVMGKAGGIPAAVVRGVRAEEAPLPASELIRSPEEDLFRESLQQTLTSIRAAVRFGRGDVPRAPVEDAVRAALHAARVAFSALDEEGEGADRWLFVGVRPGPVRLRLEAALDDAYGPTLAEAPLLIVPLIACAEVGGSDVDGSSPERDAVRIRAGAGIQSLRLALHAQGFSSSWSGATLGRRVETLDALGIADEWTPLGVIAAGPSSSEPVPPASPLDVGESLRMTS